MSSLVVSTDGFRKCHGFALVLVCLILSIISPRFRVNTSTWRRMYVSRAVSSGLPSWLHSSTTRLGRHRSSDLC